MENKKWTVASHTSDGIPIKLMADVESRPIDTLVQPAKPGLFGKILGIAKKAVANPLVQQAVTAAVLGKLNKVIKGK